MLLHTCECNKMASNKCDIQEDEFLAIEMYNKALKGYKETHCKKNAWRVIDEKLGYEEGNLYLF